MKAVFQILGRTFARFFRDAASTEAAALAFYTALSLAPLLMILLYIGALIAPDAQEQLIHQIVRFVGKQSGDIIRQVIASLSEQRSAGSVSAVLGGITLLISATGVFTQLHASMNRIWGVWARQGRGLFFWLRQRLLSLGMVAGAGLLMVVSLAVSATLHVVFAGERTAWHRADLIISLALYTVVFGLIFKVLPDVKNIRWRDTLPGALTSSVLFIFGKLALGRYFSFTSTVSAYGAAGSLVVFWAYYAALIVFFGAELTQVYTHHHGREIVPLNHATRE